MVLVFQSCCWIRLGFQILMFIEGVLGHRISEILHVNNLGGKILKSLSYGSVVKKATCPGNAPQLMVLVVEAVVVVAAREVRHVSSYP